MIKIYTKSELKQLISESFFNATNKVTLVSNNSVISGIINAMARLFNLGNKELAITEMYLDLNTAYGDYLDKLAVEQYGVAPRFGAKASSTYLRLKASSGTTYIAGTHNFTGDHGVIFELDSDVTVGLLGYTYAKVHSTTTGFKTNVNPLSINKITTALIGHISCLNEYIPFGGADSESDDVFRSRIKNSINIGAKNTLAQLTQIFQKTNENVLSVYNYGFSNTSKVKLAISTQNGQDLTNGELALLTSNASEYLSLTELSVYGSNYVGIELVNVEYQLIDITFKAEFFDNTDIEDWRKECQIKISKFIDYRIWPKDRSVLDRGDLLAICKSISGVKYIPDAFFFPRTDIAIEYGKMPRIRSFLIYSLQNNLLSGVEDVMNPIYYPNSQDIEYQQTNLMTV